MAKVKITRLNNEEKNARGINNWPIWTKEASSFDWYYDSTEHCQIIEGDVTVHTEEGDFNFKEGDFVTFEKGLKCVWEIKKAVKKHYEFE